MRISEKGAAILAVALMVGCKDASSTSAPGGSASSASQRPGICIEAAESMSADHAERSGPPFADCAKSLMTGCPSTDGKRSGLCTYFLDTGKTTDARVTKSNTCCY